MRTARWSFWFTAPGLLILCLGCENAKLPSAPAVARPVGSRDVIAAGGPAVPDRAFTAIDAPGATFTEALDIGPSGDIVGRYVSSDGRSHGYLLHEGTFTTIDLSATLTSAQGIAPNGDIVGRYQTADGKLHGFLLSAGAFTAIDVPSAVGTNALGINPRGDVVGAYCDPAGCPPTASRADLGKHGFLLRDGTFTPIDFPGAAITQAFRIRAAGQIAGRYRGADGHWHAFVFREGQFTSIDVPGALEVASFPPPVGINAAGDVVSSFCAAAPCPVRLTDKLATVHGFLLPRANGETGGPITTIDVPGALGTAAYSINTRGDIVGAYADPNHKAHGFLLSRANDSGVP